MTHLANTDSSTSQQSTNTTAHRRFPLARSVALVAALVLTLLAVALPAAFAQVQDTPPSNANNVYDLNIAPGLSRTGPISGGCNGGGLGEWRVDRGYAAPSRTPHLLSNPLHPTGLALGATSALPDNFTGHVPVYSEGNWWPYVGPQQASPAQQQANDLYNRELRQDAGLYFQNGQVVATSEPLFVPGRSGLRAVNETNCSYFITTGSFPGSEQPGQSLTYLGPGSSAEVPLAPSGWYPGASSPETYSSVAGLNAMHIPGWHHSSWSPQYSGGDQSRDFGTPGFAYNFDPNTDGNGNIFANLRTAEGYDPLISGDPGYGVAFYSNGQLQGVINLERTSNHSATGTIVARSEHNPGNYNQGPVTVVGAIIQTGNAGGEYRYITHDSARSLIDQHRNQPGWQEATTTYNSNQSANPGGVYIPPAAVGAVVPAGDAGGDVPGGAAGEGVTLEAESGEPLGGAIVYSDDAASGGQAVGETLGNGRGVRLNMVSNAQRLTVAYASQFSGTTSIRVNGQVQTKLNFNSTGAWSGDYRTATVDVDLRQGDVLDLVYLDGDTALNLDWVRLGSDGNVSAKRVEAENGNMVGGNDTYRDDAASGGAAVGQVDGQAQMAQRLGMKARQFELGARTNQGVSFDNVPTTNVVRLGYSAVTHGKVSFFVNGEPAGRFAIAPTGGWAGLYGELDFPVQLNAGDMFEVRMRAGDEPINIDWVQFENHANGFGFGGNLGLGDFGRFGDVDRALDVFEDLNNLNRGIDIEGLGDIGFDEFGLGISRPGIDTEFLGGFNDAGFNQAGFDQFGFNADGLDQWGFDAAGFNQWGFDAAGFNQSGFNANGFNFDGFDAAGFNQSGFNANGFNFDGFDAAGFNQWGFDAAGFDLNGFNQSGFNANGFNFDGFDAAGFDAAGFNLDGFNAAGFNQSGFNQWGFDAAGFDAAGFNQWGFNSAGFNQWGFDAAGYDQWGFNANGFDQWGFNNAGFNNAGFNNAGFNQWGFDAFGFDQWGYDSAGFNQWGYNNAGFNQWGYDAAGYDQWGFNANGFDQWGFNNAGFNQNGFDAFGFDQWGYDANGLDQWGFDNAGYDQWGFDANGLDQWGFDQWGFDNNGFDADDEIDYHNDPWSNDNGWNAPFGDLGFDGFA